MYRFSRSTYGSNTVQRIGAVHCGSQELVRTVGFVHFGVRTPQNSCTADLVHGRFAKGVFK